MYMYLGIEESEGIKHQELNQLNGTMMQNRMQCNTRREERERF